MAIQIARRHFNVDEYDRMIETGILSKDDRVELIEGEIVEMTPIGIRHVACVDRLDKLLNRQVGDAVIVRNQGPVQLNNLSQLQPDFALLKARADFYAHSYPMPPDVLLLIEVSDTTIGSDRHLKVPLYARAGITEVWLVNLPEDVIEVYTDPVAGAYQQFRRAQRDEALMSINLPSAELRVDDILG